MSTHRRCCCNGFLTYLDFYVAAYHYPAPVSNTVCNVTAQESGGYSVFPRGQFMCGEQLTPAEVEAYYNDSTPFPTYKPWPSNPAYAALEISQQSIPLRWTAGGGKTRAEVYVHVYLPQWSVWIHSPTPFWSYPCSWDICDPPEQTVHYDEVPQLPLGDYFGYGSGTQVLDPVNILDVIDYGAARNFYQGHFRNIVWGGATEPPLPTVVLSLGVLHLKIEVDQEFTTLAALLAAIDAETATVTGTMDFPAAQFAMTFLQQNGFTYGTFNKGFQFATGESPLIPIPEPAEFWDARALVTLDGGPTTSAGITGSGPSSPDPSCCADPPPEGCIAHAGIDPAFTTSQSYWFPGCAGAAIKYCVFLYSTNERAGLPEEDGGGDV